MSNLCFLSIELKLNFQNTQEQEDGEEGRLEMAEDAMEEEEENLQSLVEEVQNKVKLPVDLIMGNPALVSILSIISSLNVRGH